MPSNIHINFVSFQYNGAVLTAGAAGTLTETEKAPASIAGASRNFIF